MRRSALTLVAGLAVLAVAAPADAEAGGDWRTLAQTSKVDAHAQRMINMPGVFRLNVSAPEGRVYVDIEYTCDFEQVDGGQRQKYPMRGIGRTGRRDSATHGRERLVPRTNHGLKLFEAWWTGRCHVDLVAYRGDLGTDGGSVSLKLQRRTRR